MRLEDVAAKEAQRIKGCIGCVKAKRANLHAELPPPVEGCECYQQGQEILAAVIPAIQAEALEWAAVTAEAFPLRTHGGLATDPYASAEQAADEIAAAIRAMKEPTP
jgi:hypothetical protein